MYNTYTYPHHIYSWLLSLVELLTVLSLYIYIYIYIYTQTHNSCRYSLTHIHYICGSFCVCVYIYIYIYIYIHTQQLCNLLFVFLSSNCIPSIFCLCLKALLYLIWQKSQIWFSVKSCLPMTHPLKSYTWPWSKKFELGHVYKINLYFLSTPATITHIIKAHFTLIQYFIWVS